MDQFRPRFLGQVSFGSLGTKMTVTWKDLTVPEDARPPEGKDGCIYIGARSFSSNAKIEENIASAKAAGYGDIHELDVPPCDPNEAFGVSCLVSGSTPSKYVWACPTTYQPEQAPREGCTKIGVQDSWLINSSLQDKLDKAKASGFEVIFVPTGRVFNEGTKSRSDEKVIWACSATGQITPQSPSEAPIPTGPSLVPVAVGAGVVAVLVAFAGGLFGK